MEVKCLTKVIGAVLALSLSETIVFAQYTALEYALADATLTTKIDSYGNYRLKGKTFFIAPGDSDISFKDLEFIEYANYVAGSLELSGAHRVSDYNAADICILITYSIQDKQVSETIPVPIRGITGSSTSSYGSAYGSAYSNENYGYGNVSGYGTGSVSANTHTTTTYEYGTVGYTQTQTTTTEYQRVLNVYAYDNHSLDTDSMLWKTNLVSTGSKSSLRSILPYMAWAAIGKYGKKASESFTNIEPNKRVESFIDYSCNDYCYINPKCNTVINNGFELSYVTKDEGSTTVVLKSVVDRARIKVGDGISIVYNGSQYHIHGAIHLWSQNQVFLNSKKSVNQGDYLKLSFPEIPEDAESIQITDSEGNIWFDNIVLKR